MRYRFWRGVQMKIKMITKINKLGTFDNFQWEKQCEEFGQYNFFYGWNYSGKTTLSRIFRCLEMKVPHDDFPDAEFSIESDNGNITQRNISAGYIIRVFNEDFIEKNFKWNNEKADIDPVLILGEEVKDLENKVKELTEQKEAKENKLKKAEEKKQSKERELNNSLTDKASEIRNILGITNPREFDKGTLEEKIKTIKVNYKDYILSVDEEKNKLNFYRSKKEENVKFESPQLEFSTLIFAVKDILFQKVTAQQIIEKYKENPKLRDWVKAGIELHQNEVICQFCGNSLPPDLLERLNRYFSDEFDNLMKQINNKGKEISNHIETIKNLKMPDRARLFEDLQSRFEDNLKSLNIKKDNYIQALVLLKDELKKKREKPFDSLEIQTLSDYTKELKKALEEIKQIIDKHNAKVDSFESEKQRAKEKLINHYAADFIKEKRYFEVQKEISKMSDDIYRLELKIGELNAEIENINRQIKAEAIGADKINEYLKQFFNDDKLKIELMDDGRYKLYRNDKVAKNLSTGEKNIISLVYFFTRLEETGFDLSNAVIFIDDPVCSLDSNHTFKVYGFINEKLKDCGQLFITTHNFEFFNLLKDMSRYDLSNKGKFYLVKMVKNQEKEFSCIENLPNTLLKYKSEYNYLFSILKLFNESNGKSNFEFLFLLPNILRRFFESYLFMKYPDGRKFNKKAEIFFKNENISDKQKSLKLMDEYSHEQDPTHAHKFPDIIEVEDAIRFILQTIKKEDEEHYESLCNSLTNNSN